jgi:hypothetical protein
LKFISGNPALFQLAADLQASHPPAPRLSPGKNIIAYPSQMLGQNKLECWSRESLINLVKAWVLVLDLAPSLFPGKNIISLPFTDGGTK